MSWLLDVNLILASRWTSHPEHLYARVWLGSLGKFHTTPITELGFVRISLSAAYGATWDETQETLQKLHAVQPSRARHGEDRLAVFGQHLVNKFADFQFRLHADHRRAHHRADRARDVPLGDFFGLMPL